MKRNVVQLPQVYKITPRWSTLQAQGHIMLPLQVKRLPPVGNITKLRLYNVIVAGLKDYSMPVTLQVKTTSCIIHMKVFQLLVPSSNMEAFHFINL